MPSATVSSSAPVYIPMHKRTPSSSSTASSSHPLTYSRDELLAMAPSTSTSPAPSPSSSPYSSGSHFPSSFTGSDHLEHTYAHPLGPSPNHPDAQGWLALNTAMRSYLRTVCPDIVMNRKMRKAVEYASFQHRTGRNVGAKSPSRGDEQQRGVSRGSETKRERPASPLKESTNAPEEHQHTEAVATTPSTRPGTPAKRPPPRRTPASRAPRTPRTANTRTRYNSFALFHRQIEKGAGSEGNWRRPTAEVASIGA